MSEPTEETPLKEGEGEVLADPGAIKLGKMQKFAAIAAHFWGLVALIANYVWFVQAGGAAKVFHWHPLFMDIAFIFMSISTLSFQYYTLFSRPVRKTIHAIGWVITIICAAVAMWAVITQHNNHPYAHMVSLHSWVGLFTMIFFVLQFLFGSYAYGAIDMGATLEYKKQLMVYHKYYGNVIYQLTALTCLLGIQEKEGFLPTNCEYHINHTQFDPWIHLGNIPAQCKSAHTMAFGILVMSVLTSFAVHDFGKKSVK